VVPSIWIAKSADERGIQHSVLYHSLDVAAVAALLSHTSEAKIFTLFAALHDVGKIGARFQLMLRDGTPQNYRHWEVTEAHLHANDDLLAAAIGGTLEARRALYAACAGHHGRPPTLTPLKSAEWRSMVRSIGSDAQIAAREFIEILLDLFPVAQMTDCYDANAASWRLPGFIALADWIGSNTEWFPAVDAVHSATDYLEIARGRAEVAVAATGLGRAEGIGSPSFDFSLSPLQLACTHTPLPDTPTLAILEDETGAGKTEAALILAGRMLARRHGRGIYFALPTMATADAMFARSEAIVRQMFDTPPSLTLAHGRAQLSETWAEVRGREGGDGPGCSAWLADDRRKALLADVGVGTIDQALLAILPTRHSTMRLHGLSSKILIVDEAHEMADPYMGALLAKLLYVHARMGGSAILLSATLPLNLRAQLVGAFEAGAGRETTSVEGERYPALVINGRAKGIAPRTVARGPVHVTRLDSADTTLDMLEAKARAGAACAWVRNAVDDAIEAYEVLKARGIPCDLLHARFVLADRKLHEATALRRFGKHREGGAGRVLISTQVIESSLDLDFDVMVSDVAPMASLIQRAGRLWRHMEERPSSSRAVEGPCLHVLAPDPDVVKSSQWLGDVLGAGAFVYPVPSIWRTARILFDAGEIRAPQGLRGLIEPVHGAEAIPVPEVLEQAEIDRLGAVGAERGQGLRNAIDWDAGYRAMGACHPEADYPTRLSGETRDLLLLRKGEHGLEPLHGDGSIRELPFAQVSASMARLKGIDLPIVEADTFTRNWPGWLIDSLTLCVVEEDGMIAPGLRYSAERGLIFTSPN